jgi:hypothetical protein
VNHQILLSISGVRLGSTKCVVNVINNSAHIRPVVYPSNPSLSIRAGTVKSLVWDLFFHSHRSTSEILNDFADDAGVRQRRTRPTTPTLAPRFDPSSTWCCPAVFSMTSPNSHRPEGRLRLHGVEQRPQFLLEGWGAEFREAEGVHRAGPYWWAWPRCRSVPSLAFG